jgi:hypothetical protein
LLLSGNLVARSPSPPPPPPLAAAAAAGQGEVNLATAKIRRSRKTRLSRCSSVQSCRTISAVVMIVDTCKCRRRALFTNLVLAELSPPPPPLFFFLLCLSCRVPAADAKRSQVRVFWGTHNCCACLTLRARRKPWTRRSYSLTSPRKWA